ncbi:MAG: DUF5985 family protein [Pseudomonadota bacterium]
MVQGFMLGVIVCSCFVAGTFFLKFWRQTRDVLFLAFGAAFIIEGINRTCLMFVEHPNRGHVVIYLVRLICYLLILGAIVYKNRRPT